MEDLYESFNANSWILANSNSFERFIPIFSDKMITIEKTWIEAKEFSVESEPINAKNFESYNYRKLIVTNEIAGFRILESKSIEKLGGEFASFLSKRSEVYKFSIDIWIPIMSFQYYENGAQTRSLEYELDMENHTTKEIASGTELKFEKLNLEMPHPEDGYDDFYYPLAIMQYLGISSQDLIKCLHEKCAVYLLKDEYSKG